MRTTNLLPKSDQTTISLLRTARTIRLAAFAVSTLLVINGVLVLPTYLPLAFEKEEIARAFETETKAQQKFQVSESLKELQNLSRVTREIRSYMSRPHYSSPILTSVFENGIPGISIESITVSDNGAIAINGRASTRDALLRFEEKFKTSSFFEKISFPLSNIIRETDIIFSIQGTVKPEFIENLR